MNDNDFGRKIGQILSQGSTNLDTKVAKRLHEARQKALLRYHAPVHGLQAAGIAHLLNDLLFGHLRILLAVLALLFGASFTYYWNQLLQADEYEEIDSALLADDLPPAAFLDHGFHAWLERSSQQSSSPQQ